MRQQSNSAWLRPWQTARAPIIGLLIGVFLARGGLKEMTVFHYFREQAAQDAGGADKSANRPVNLQSLDELTNRDPRLATEPAVRVVT